MRAVNLLPRDDAAARLAEDAVVALVAGGGARSLTVALAALFLSASGR